MQVEAHTRDGEVITVTHDMGLRGSVHSVGWHLPPDLTEDEWKGAGQLLGKVERSVAWWLGDWWAYGEARYGERKAITDADEWDGPSYESCRQAAWVCRAFETVRRRTDLSFKHHAEVASLPASDADLLLDRAVAEGWSTRVLRGEVSRLKPLLGGEPVSGQTAWDDFAALVASGTKFGTIYADPPWLYGNQATRAATSNHYDGMTVDELCALPVRDLVAKDAHLHLWTTNGFIFDCPRIFEAWGFEFRSSLIWVKPQMGIGNYWRNSHEFLLTAIRGNAKRFNNRSLMSWLKADRKRHSAKPPEVRRMLERASPGPYLEMFARTKEPGWSVWGNQVETTLFSEAAE